jgi:hypothetical protein
MVFRRNPTNVKANFLILSSIVLAAVSAGAAPIVGIGTPANSYLSTPTGPSPSFGTLFNFDLLMPGSTFNASQYAAQGVKITSPDGLVVEPYSTQSSPNELFDNSANGTANIKIMTFGTGEIGIGIADSDPVTITLQALNASGSGFGGIFNETLPAGGSNPGNGYFTISDTGYDICGVQILESVGSASYSGLAIDDLQVAATPEPAALALLGAGAVLLGVARLRKRVVKA